MSAVYSGITVDIAEESLERVQKMLAGIRGGWQKAVGSALARAAASGKTATKKAVTAEYTISQGTYLAETRNINHFQRSSDGDVSVVFGYRGNVISLMKFKTKVSKSGAVTTQVKRSNGATVLEHAFRATMGGHTGIYERVGPDRFPVKELFGPATPQMMYSDEAITDAAEETMAKTYEVRIEHEILRLMNGWGG